MYEWLRDYQRIEDEINCLEHNLIRSQNELKFPYNNKHVRLYVFPKNKQLSY